MKSPKISRYYMYEGWRSQTPDTLADTNLKDERDDRIFAGWLAVLSILANTFGAAYLIGHFIGAHGLWAGWWAR